MVTAFDDEISSQTIFRHHILRSPLSAHFKTLRIVVKGSPGQRQARHAQDSDLDSVSDEESYNNYEERQAAKQNMDAVVAYAHMLPNLQHLEFDGNEFAEFTDFRSSSPLFKTSFEELAKKMSKLSAIDLHPYDCVEILPLFKAIHTLNITSENAETPDTLEFNKENEFLPILSDLPLLKHVTRRETGSRFLPPPLPPSPSKVPVLSSLVLDIPVLEDSRIDFIAAFPDVETLVVDVENWKCSLEAASKLDQLINLRTILDIFVTDR